MAFPNSSFSQTNYWVDVVFQAPVSVAADQSAVAVNEGSTATNTGTFSNVGSSNVTISASIGAITKSGAASGTWSWSFATTDGPDQSQTVTITANDGNGGVATTTFALTVNNVAPTISLSGNATTVVGAQYSLTLGNVVDPGTDTVTAYQINWGDGQTDSFTGSPNGLIEKHAYLHVGNPVISVDLTDEDGTFAAAGTRSLTVGKGTPNLTWSTPADITYGAALGASQLSATADVGGSFLYTPASVAVLSAGAGQNLSVVFTPTDTADYNTASASVSINVLKAPLTVTADDKAKSYDSFPYTPFTATALGLVNGDTLAGLGTVTFGGSGASAVNAGAYAIVPSSLTAPNYSITYASGTLTIGKATPSVNLTPISVTYDGQAHSGSGTVTGVSSEDFGAATMSYSSGTAPLNAGSYTMTGSFAGNSNYNPASATVAIDIAQADAVISVGGYSGTYDALAHGASGSASGVSSEDLSSLQSLGSSFTNAGDYTANWSFAGNVNYKTASGSVAIHIGKADQVIGWSIPAGIVYGTPLSDSQLNATVAGVLGGTPPGNLHYGPVADTVLSAGTNVLHVDAAATDNYNAASATVTLEVAQAPLTISADDQLKTHDGLSFSGFTATALGLVNGDTLASLASLAFGGDSQAAIGPGTYTITVGGLSDVNYAITYDSGTLSILPGVIQGSADADTLTLRLDPTGTYAQFFENVPVTEAPTFFVLASLLDHCEFDGLGGNDTLVVDLANGNPIPVGGITYDGGMDANKLSIKGTPGDDAFAITGGSVQIGGRTISYSGVGQVDVDGGTGNDALTASSGTVNLGALSQLALIANGTSNVNLLESTVLSSLSISGSARVNLTAGGGKALQIGNTSAPATPASLSFTLPADTSPAQPFVGLDLNDNGLIVQAGSTADRNALLGTIGGLVARSRNAFAASNVLWAGNGIRSNNAALEAAADIQNHTGLTGLAVIPNVIYSTDGTEAGALMTTFKSQSGLNASAVLAGYTFNGDANLDGRITFDDYFQTNNGFLSGGTKAGYIWGDFDYSGHTDFDDYFLMNQAFLRQASHSGPIPMAKTATPFSTQTVQRSHPRRMSLRQRGATDVSRRRGSRAWDRPFTPERRMTNPDLALSESQPPAVNSPQTGAAAKNVE